MESIAVDSKVIATRAHDHAVDMERLLYTANGQVRSISRSEKSEGVDSACSA